MSEPKLSRTEDLVGIFKLEICYWMMKIVFAEAIDAV